MYEGFSVETGERITPGGSWVDELSKGTKPKDGRSEEHRVVEPGTAEELDLVDAILRHPAAGGRIALGGIEDRGPKKELN